MHLFVGFDRRVHHPEMIDQAFAVVSAFVQSLSPMEYHEAPGEGLRAVFIDPEDPAELLELASALQAAVGELVPPDYFKWLVATVDPPIDPDFSIYELDLSVRAQNRLEGRLGTNPSIGQLVLMTEASLLDIRSLGTKVLEEIKQRLRERGWYLLG